MGAYADIREQENRAQVNILRQELTPIIYHWYRHILGRDPSQSEYESVLLTADYEAQAFDLESFKGALVASEERESRQEEVDAIRQNVRLELARYLALNGTERLAYAQSFGIEPADVAALTNVEVIEINAWLESQSLHFGQSAYLALEAMLADAGHSFNRVFLATHLILIDILTGTITPFESGDLVLSVYALGRVAEIRGLSLEGYAMNYNALLAMFEDECYDREGGNPVTGECGFRVVAHINGNHFIIVTGVSAEAITFTDPGAGPADDLDQVTMSRDEFLSVWIDSRHGALSVNANPLSPPNANPLSPPNALVGGPATTGFGYILTPRVPPTEEVTAAEPSVILARELSVHEQMNVRGAFFGIFIAAVVTAAVNAVIATVAGVIAGITTAIASIVAGVGAVVSGFSGLFSGILAGNFMAGLGSLFQGLLVGLDFLAGGLLGGALEVIGAFASGFQIFQTGFLSAIKGLPVLGGLLQNSVLGGFLEYAFYGLVVDGTGQLIDKIDVSGNLFGSTFQLGRVLRGIGALATGNPLLLAAGLSEIGAGAREFLSLHFDLSPQFTNMLGLSASALGAFATGSLSAALPFLSMDFASAGLTALGSHLSWDPAVLSLLQVPVRLATGSFVESGFNVGELGGILGDLSEQAIGGLISVGTSIGLDALGAPGALQNFLPTLLGSLALGNGGDSHNGLSPEATGQGIFERIASTAARFGQGILRGVGDVLSFGASVIENGFSQAMELFAGMLGREIQEGAIHAGGVGAGGSFADAFNGAITIGDITEGSFSDQQGNLVNYRYDAAIGELTIGNDRVTETYINPRVSGGLFGFESAAFAEELETKNMVLSYHHDDGGINFLLANNHGEELANIKFSNIDLASGVIEWGDGNQLIVENGQVVGGQRDYALDITNILTQASRASITVAPSDQGNPIWDFLNGLYDDVSSIIRPDFSNEVELGSNFWMEVNSNLPDAGISGTLFHVTNSWTILGGRDVTLSKPIVGISIDFSSRQGEGLEVGAGLSRHMGVGTRINTEGSLTSYELHFGVSWPPTILYVTSPPLNND